MIVNFIHGNISGVSFIRVTLFGGAGAPCTGDHCMHIVCATNSRVSSIRISHSNVRHNGLIGWCIVPAISVVVRSPSNTAGCSIGVIVIATTIHPSTATTATLRNCKTYDRIVPNRWI